MSTKLDQAHWDAYVGGVDDSGQNLEDFLQLLKSHDLNIEEFLASFKASRMGVSDFVGQLDETQSYRTQSEAEAIVEALKLVWDVIKSGKPVTSVDGLDSSILHGKDKNWANYLNSQSAEIPFAVRARSTLFVTIASAKGTIRLHYRANHKQVATYPGHFVPAISVAVKETWALWPNSLDAKASLSRPVNIGGVTADNPPNPQSTLRLSFGLSNLLVSTRKNLNFTFTGKNGWEK